MDSEGGKRLKKEIISFFFFFRETKCDNGCSVAVGFEMGVPARGLEVMEAWGFMGGCEKDSRGTAVDPKY